MRLRKWTRIGTQVVIGLTDPPDETGLEQLNWAIQAFSVALGESVEGHGQPDDPGSLPPRPDLAIGALQIAMKTTTDPEVRPWLQTALDFLTGDYEPLEDDDVAIICNQDEGE